jgi:hypothetical protein
MRYLLNILLLRVSEAIFSLTLAVCVCVCLGEGDRNENCCSEKGMYFIHFYRTLVDLNGSHFAEDEDEETSERVATRIEYSETHLSEKSELHWRVGAAVCSFTLSGCSIVKEMRLTSPQKHVTHSACTRG